MATEGDAHQAFLASKYFPALDGVRALAVLMVGLAHAPQHELWSGMKPHLGVSLFFGLSGFLITTLGLREWDRNGTFDLRGFYIRRAFRILPVYYFVFGLYVITILGFGMATPEMTQKFLEHFWHYALFFQEFGDLPTFYQSWSLGIEEKFYLVWPVLIFVTFTTGRLGVTLTAFFAVSALGMWVNAGFLSYGTILAGCVPAVLLHDPKIYGNLAQGLRRLGPVPYVWLGLLLVAGFEKGHPFVFSIAVAASLGAVVVKPDGLMNRFLSTKPLVFIGRMSYGIYLIHLLVKNAVLKFVPVLSNPYAYSLLSWGVFMGVSVGAAYGMHRMIEKPLIEKGRRLAARR